MKSLLGFISVMLMAISFQSSAAIHINGDAVLLEHQGDVYVVPSDYKNTGDYYYVTVDDSKRVCYLAKQSNLDAVDMVVINVKTEGKIVPWNCYAFDQQYFEITP